MASLSEFNMKTHGYNLSSSSSTSTITNSYGSHVAGIKKAMKLLETQFGNPHASSSSSSSSTNNNVVGVINENNTMMTMNDTSCRTISASVNVNNKKAKKNIDDGRTHSLAYKKYGPYICPKCNQVFVTSQKFASHASSHYKFESEEERKKRFMSRIRKRPKHHVQKLNDGTTTFVPVSSSTAHNQIALPPSTGVKIKLEYANN